MTYKLLGKERNIYVFDYEVLSNLKVPHTNKSYWCVAFKNHYTGKWKIIKNDRKALVDFYNATKDDIFVSFNGRHYDQFIHKGIIMGYDPGEISDKIINQKMQGFNVLPNSYKVSFYNYDLANTFSSLKQLEAFMGNDIQESSVPFDIDRPLTVKEEQELIKYMCHDVNQTDEVLKVSWDSFTSHLGLMEMFNLNMNDINKTNAKLTANILEAKKLDNFDDEFDVEIPDTLKLDKYHYIKDYFEYIKYNAKPGDKPTELVTMIGDMETTYALGGVHGVIRNYTSKGLVYALDVASLYPALIIEYGLMSRAVLSTEKFKEIRDTRLAYKAVKNPLQAALKLTINSVYGCFGDKNNALYDPKMMRSVCVHGMLLITDFVEKIEPYCKLLNLNTDGIYFEIEDKSQLTKIMELADEWQKRTRLELELEEFKKIIQKDVNNYIVIPNGDLYNEKGKPLYKGKGAYVKSLSKLDYDLPIVNEAVIKYFAEDKPVEETVHKCDELIKFQKVVKLTSAYDYVLKDVQYEKVKEVNEKTGRLRTVEKLINPGVRMDDKTYRVFASTRNGDYGIYKKRGEENPAKFANTPLKCFVDNGEVNDKSCPEYLDKEYYVELSKSRINQFLGLDKKGNPLKVKSKLNDSKYRTYNL